MTGEIWCPHGYVVDNIPAPTVRDFQEWFDEQWDSYAEETECRTHPSSRRG